MEDTLRLFNKFMDTHTKEEIQYIIDEVNDNFQITPWYKKEIKIRIKIKDILRLKPSY